LKSWWIQCKIIGFIRPLTWGSNIILRDLIILIVTIYKHSYIEVIGKYILLYLSVFWAKVEKLKIKIDYWILELFRQYGILLVFLFLFLFFFHFISLMQSRVLPFIASYSTNLKTFSQFSIFYKTKMSLPNTTYLKMWKQWLIFPVRINNFWSLRVSYYNNINSSHIFFRKNNVFIHERSVSPVSHWCMIGLIWNKDLDGHVKT
jgi:hypothetical protein